MTQEEKDLLLKDLCARLPYGVKAYIKNWSKLDMKYYEGVYRVESIDPFLNHIEACSERNAVEVIVGYDDYEIKPYLLPLLSRTEEQEKESSFESSLLNAFINGYISQFEDGELNIDDLNRLYDWLNKNHFDYRGLIEKGLAIDATNLNIY